MQVFSCDNNLIVLDPRIGYSSAAVCLRLHHGSRDEEEAESGYTHLIEHLLARLILPVVEGIGARSEVYTTKDCICISVHAPRDWFDHTVKTVLGIVCHPEFSERDIAQEVAAIRREAESYGDSPAYQSKVIAESRLFSGSTLALPIWGNINNVAVANCHLVMGFYNAKIRSSGWTLSAVGSFSEDAIAEAGRQFSTAFMSTKSLKHRRIDGIPRIMPSGIVKMKSNQFHVNISSVFRPEEESVMSLALLKHYLVGTSRSALTEHLRHKLGLVYSVIIEITLHKDIGYSTVYASTDSLHTAFGVLEESFHVIERLVDNGVEPELLSYIGRSFRGHVNLAREDLLTFADWVTRWSNAAIVLDGLDSMENRADRDFIRNMFAPESSHVTICGPAPNDEILCRSGGKWHTSCLDSP